MASGPPSALFSIALSRIRHKLKLWPVRAEKIMCEPSHAMGLSWGIKPDARRRGPAPVALARLFCESIIHQSKLASIDGVGFFTPRKRIVVPSGAQVGERASTKSDARRCGSPPDVGTTQIWPVGAVRSPSTP